MDFENPDHGFVLIDENARFTSLKAVAHDSMKIIRKDQQLNKILNDISDCWRNEDKQGTETQGTKNDVKSKKRGRGRPKAQQQEPSVPDKNQSKEVAEEDEEINSSSDEEKETREAEDDNSNPTPTVLIPDEEEGQISDEDIDSDFCRRNVPALSESVQKTLALIERTQQTHSIIPIQNLNKRDWSKLSEDDNLFHDTQTSRVMKKVRIAEDDS